MEKRVRFLLVEDSEDDEELLLRVLHRAGFVTEHQRVFDLAILRSLDFSGWDLILSDYYLPGYSGADVLKLVQACPSPPPVIILSGRTGESIAVDMIQAGASDYVMKDNLARLPVAVDLGLREARSRAAKQRTEAQVSRLNRVYQILSAINKAIFRTPDPQVLLQEVCGIATRFGQYSFVRVVQHRGVNLVPSASSRTNLLAPSLDPPTVLERSVLASGEILLLNDPDTVRTNLPSPFLSCGIFPLRVLDSWWGCLSFYSLDRNVFNPEEVSLLKELAQDLAWALESRQMEQRRYETDQFFQDMTNLVPGLFYKLQLGNDGLWKFLYVSPGVDLFLPYTPQQVLADSTLYLLAVHPEDRALYDRTIDRSARDLTVFSLEFRLVRPNGTVVWTLATAFPQKLQEGAVVWTGLAIDVTPQNKLQVALQREQELLAVTLENIGDGVLVIDSEARLVLINRTAETLLGWTADAVTGRHWSELELRLPWEARDTLTPWTVVRPDGHELHLETHVSDLRDTEGETRGRVMLLRDVSLREKIEERLRQSEKLESVGLLAGGIAHDFNNLLTGVFGFLQLARMNPEDPERVAQYLDSALGPFERARILTQQLLTFAKGGQPSRKPFILLESLRATLDFHRADTAIAIDLTCDEQPWPIVANEGQINQVFENLVLNAKQALGNTGRIDVIVKNLQWGHPEMDLPEGPYLLVEIADDGPGIPASILPRIFDPFFTTKPAGTGLGLSICFSVIRKHQGTIEVESTPGKGTKFRIYLPAAPKD